jgi:hypothetical protein
VSCPHEWISDEVDMTCLDDLSVVLGGSTLRFAERHRAVDPTTDGRSSWSKPRSRVFPRGWNG